jgi:hypothetical protein
MTINGVSPRRIAAILSEEQVEKPSYYMVKNDMPGAKKTRFDNSAPYGWSDTTVARILGRPEYLGHVVNFRSFKESYKDKYYTSNAPENWKIFENRHEAIIEQSTFDTVQKLRGTPRRQDKTGEANPLTGLLFCHDCGAKMYNNRHSKETYEVIQDGKLVTRKSNDTYNCSTYMLGKNKFVERCSGHHIRTIAIRELILDSIRNICGYVRENQSEFVERIREDSILYRNETAKLHKKAITRNTKRISELENLFRRTYEDNVNGKLSDTRFEQMSADYEREQTTLVLQNTEMQAELDSFNADNEKVDSFIGLVRKYTEFEELTTAMLNEFVDKVFIHKADKNIWGERTQRVDIHFNFIGEFIIAEEIEKELTAEDLEALERLRIKRAKQREANLRFRAKQKAKHQQEQAGNPA